MTNETEIQGSRVKLYRLGRRPYLVEQPQSIVAYRGSEDECCAWNYKKLEHIDVIPDPAEAVVQYPVRR